MGNVVKVNINGLRSYADRIDNVNRRLANVDRALDSLRHTVNVRNANLALSADLIIGRSSTLKRCSEYLRKTASDFEQVENYLASVDPRSFEKPSYDVVTSDDWREKVGRAVKVKVEEVKSFVSDTYNAIKKGISDTCEYIKYSYESGGWVYKTVKIGGQVVQFVGGVAEVSAALSEILISGGTLTPLAIAQMVDGVNKIWSSEANIFIMAKTGDMETDVNYLRDAAGGIGQSIGGDFGKSVGELTYFGFSFFTDAATMVDSAGKVINMAKGKKITELVSGGFTTVKDIMNTNVNLHTIKTVKELYNSSNELRTVVSFVSAGKDAYSAYKSGVELRNSAVQTSYEGAKAIVRTIIKQVVPAQ